VKTKRETFVTRKRVIINYIPSNCLEKTLMNASKINKNWLKYSCENKLLYVYNRKLINTLKYKNEHEQAAVLLFWFYLFYLSFSSPIIKVLRLT
jgi:hypothetical protein